MFVMSVLHRSSAESLSGRPVGEPRLDVHNSNVEEMAAEIGQCGTIDLRSGRICRLPALHAGGCDFQQADAPR
jgi:hypothetical protein